ncbi:MAG: hypothetical protein Q9P14_04810 [candidate division KSB1 bacterium]|nr:hypothetical protein [candidate division KSB1 bacterium]
MLRHHASLPTLLPLALALCLYPRPANQHASVAMFSEPVPVQLAFAEADRLHVYPQWRFPWPFVRIPQHENERRPKMRNVVLRAAAHGASRTRSDIPPAAVLRDPLQELSIGARPRHGQWLRKRNGKKGVHYHGSRRVIHVASKRWLLA